MENKRDTTADELRQIAASLVRLASELAGDSETATEPSWVAEKVANRECLQTGVIVGPEEQYRRGLSASAYQRTFNLIRERKVSEAELIQKGLLARPGKPGKRSGPDRLDNFLAEKSADAVADAAIEAAAAKGKPKKTRAKKSAKG